MPNDAKSLCSMTDSLYLSLTLTSSMTTPGNLISSYRSSRAEVSSILCILSESMVGGELVFISQQMVELTTCVVDDGGADAPADVMSDTSLFTGGGAAGETPSESMAVDVIGAEANGDANARDPPKAFPTAKPKVGLAGERAHPNLKFF